MKLEAAAGLVCTKDTPSLSISFPYAGQTAGGRDRLSARTPSLLLFMLPPSQSATLQLIKGAGGDLGF